MIRQAPRRSSTKPKKASSARPHPRLARLRVGDRAADPLDQLVDVHLEHRDVELSLGGEVLIEERLGDAGALGDGVEGGLVVAGVGEGDARGVEDRRAAVGRGHPRPWRRRTSLFSV